MIDRMRQEAPKKGDQLRKHFYHSQYLSGEREVNIKERNRAQNVFVPLTVYT